MLITWFMYSNDFEFKTFINTLGADENLRKTMGEEGKKLAAKKFNMQKNLIRTYQFYDFYGIN